MIKPKNDTLAEMLEGTRDALEKALIKIAKLEVEKSELANMVLTREYELSALRRGSR